MSPLAIAAAVSVFLWAGVLAYFVGGGRRNGRKGGRR